MPVPANLLHLFFKAVKQSTNIVDSDTAKKTFLGIFENKYPLPQPMSAKIKLR
jgi:hypothetical protein